MPKNQYVIRFYKGKISDYFQESGITKVIDDSWLKEGKVTQKPPNCFRFKGGLYLFNKDAFKGFDSKGRPIYQYVLGNSIPNGKPVKPFITDSEGRIITDEKGLPKIDSNAEPIIIDAYLFDIAFSRGEMKSVIAGSQKPTSNWDIKTLLFGAVMGAGITFMILAITGHIVGV